MSEQLPFVSVVLPTYQRENILCETIRQLLAQDYPSYELLVVDQTHQHESETEQFLRKHADQFRHFRQDMPSLPQARNYGVSNAQGEIVLFTDDDVRIQSSWIRCHVSNYLDPQIGGVAGRVIQEGLPVVATDNILRVTRWGRVIGYQASTIRTWVEWASGCNSSFRRELITQTGGFDETFQGNAMFEDVDFSFRLRRQGSRIVFDPTAVVWHLAVKEGGCQTRTQNRVNYYYWFIHNKTLFFLKNFPHRYIPLLLTANLGRALKVGLLEMHDLSDLCQLLAAMTAGFRTYQRSSHGR
jgi:GT2 family glycosyltransferase